MTREESISVSLCDETQIGRIVFRTISHVASVELPKIEAELTRQLDAVLVVGEQKETEMLRDSYFRGFSVGTATRMKRIMGQLFLHLQRALVLNIAQSLSERLTTSINEMMEKPADIEKEDEQPSNDVAHLGERHGDLSDRINEDEKRQSQCGKREGEAERDYEEISMSVDRLIARTHQVTEMLADLSKRYLELREENRRFKQTSST